MWLGSYSGAYFDGNVRSPLPENAGNGLDPGSSLVLGVFAPYSHEDNGQHHHHDHHSHNSSFGFILLTEVSHPGFHGNHHGDSGSNFFSVRDPYFQCNHRSLNPNPTTGALKFSTNQFEKMPEYSQQSREKSIPAILDVKMLPVYAFVEFFDNLHQK